MPGDSEAPMAKTAPAPNGDAAMLTAAAANRTEGGARTAEAHGENPHKPLAGSDEGQQSAGHQPGVPSMRAAEMQEDLALLLSFQSAQVPGPSSNAVDQQPGVVSADNSNTAASAAHWHLGWGAEIGGAGKTYQSHTYPPTHHYYSHVTHAHAQQPGRFTPAPAPPSQPHSGYSNWYNGGQSYPYPYPHQHPQQHPIYPQQHYPHYNPSSGQAHSIAHPALPPAYASLNGDGAEHTLYMQTPQSYHAAGTFLENFPPPFPIYSKPVFLAFCPKGTATGLTEAYYRKLARTEISLQPPCLCVALQ